MKGGFHRIAVVVFAASAGVFIWTYQENPASEKTQDRKKVRTSANDRPQVDAKRRELRADLISAGSGDGRSLEDFFRRTMEVDPEFVAGELLASGLPYQVITELSCQLIGQWPDPMKALEWADANFKGENRGRVLGCALTTLARQNPQAAVSFVENLKDSPLRTQAMQGLFKGWIESDSRGAVAYCEAMPAGEMKTRCFEQIATYWPMLDPAAATAYVVGAADGPDTAKLARSLAAHMTSTGNPIDAIKWAASLPPEASKSASQAVMIIWAGKNGNEALAYVARSGEPIRSQLGITAVGELAGPHPTETAQWLDTLPDGGDKAEMTGILMQRWLTTSPDDAARWLDTQPRGAAKDRDIIALVRREGSRDHAVALEWIQRLSTPEQIAAETQRLGPAPAEDDK